MGVCGESGAEHTHALKPLGGGYIHTVTQEYLSYSHTGNCHSSITRKSSQWREAGVVAGGSATQEAEAGGCLGLTGHLHVADPVWKEVYSIPEDDIGIALWPIDSAWEM